MWEHARPEARRVQFCKMTYPFIPLSFFSLPLKKQNQGIQSIWDRKWVRQEKGCGLKKSGFWGWARASNRHRVMDGGRGLGGRKRCLRVNRFRLESEWQRRYVWRSITPSKKVILHWNADGQENHYWGRKKRWSFHSSILRKVEIILIECTWQRKVNQKLSQDLEET